MADDKKPSGKKKYEKPSITDPETGRSGPRMDYGPVGATPGCFFGAIPSACADGDSPATTACSDGDSPTLLRCTAGTSADNSCLNGAGANQGCGSGNAPEGECGTGTSVF